MERTIFDKLQAMARRHLWLLLSGAALPCGGCCRSLRAELLARPAAPPELGLLCGAGALALFDKILSVLELQPAQGGSV